MTFGAWRFAVWEINTKMHVVTLQKTFFITVVGPYPYSNGLIPHFLILCIRLTGCWGHNWQLTIYLHV